MLVDLGSAQKALRNGFGEKKGFLDYDRPTRCYISGIDRSMQNSDHSINLGINYENHTSLSLIRQFKDLYDGIPRRPWIRFHRELINLAKGLLEGPRTSNAWAVVSNPKTPSESPRLETTRQCRQFDMGVCSSDTLASPQWDFKLTLPLSPKAAGNPVSLLKLFDPDFKQKTTLTLAT